jgi:arginine deiminase
MQREYDHYVRLLLHFLDPEKAALVEACVRNTPASERAECFVPGRPGYFNSDKVLDTQNLLAEILKDEKVKIRLVSAVCSYEEVSFAIQQRLEAITDTALLAKILISGILPGYANHHEDDQYIFPPVPNFIFTRDIGIMIKDHVLLSRMATSARRRESLITKFIALYYMFLGNPEKVIEIIEDSDYFLYEEAERKTQLITLEGGDIMMIHPRHLLVGCSERTSSKAVNEIIHCILSKPELGIEKISVVKIPKKRAQMHIDTIFTQVKRSVWVLYGQYSERILHLQDSVRKSYVMDLTHQRDRPVAESTQILQYFKPIADKYQPNKDYSVAQNPEGLEALLRQISEVDFGVFPDEVKIIYSGDNVFPHDDREQWTDSCNVVALKEGVVIGYDRNDYTSKAFKDAGFDVITTEEAFTRFAAGQDPHQLENTLILLPSAELSRARGGSHCMSMPLLRDNLLTQ